MKLCKPDIFTGEIYLLDCVGEIVVPLIFIFMAILIFLIGIKFLSEIK